MNAHDVAEERVCAFDPTTLKVGVDVLVESTIEAINPVVEKLMWLLTTNCCPREHEFAVEIALREALANAVVHGNHRDKSKKVRVCCGCDSTKGILIAIKDEGEGFDPAKAPSPLIGEHVASDHGRGIFLINMLMDETYFEDGGREIHMRKRGSNFALERATGPHCLWTLPRDRPLARSLTSKNGLAPPERRLPMPTQTIKLTRSEEVAEGTMAFRFTRPSGFEFRAGQSIDVTLMDPLETDAEGNTRAFSIASPPFEDHLTIATRMRDSAFKRVLRHAPQGLEVRVEGPGGSFTLHKNTAKPAVFLAGGIGVTPFLSMVRQAAKDKPPQLLYLFYSNRRPEDAPFLDLLAVLPAENPNFHFIATMTAMAKSRRQWTGERGVIDREMLLRHVPEPVGPIYYVAGPPAMVAAMRKMLASAGVNEDDIRTEEFSGY